MVCAECRAANPEGKKFCGECGAALTPAAEIAVAAGDGAWFCGRHTKTVTRLRCGRCEAPICPKCTVYTPAGTRCRACSKTKVALRPAGVLHSAVGTVEGLSGGRRVWYLVLWYLILSFFASDEQLTAKSDRLAARSGLGRDHAGGDAGGR